jgi:ATP-dependent Clp protease adaptor protein ClpS
MTERITKNINSEFRHLALDEKKSKIQKPPLYSVVLVNDDFTPMEFVVEILVTIFGMSKPKATKIMFEVHTAGKAICGIYTHDIAETKVFQVTSIAKQQQHPLLCAMEKV